MNSRLTEDRAERRLRRWRRSPRSRPARRMAQTVISPAQDIVLSIGRGQLVTVPGNMADIFVANDAVADVQVKSQRQLYVFGKAGGETTVYASNAAGDIIWSANVRVGSNLDSIDQMLALAMPEAKISVATMGTNTVLLTGTVAAPEDAAEAERLVAAFVGEGANVVTPPQMATPLQVNLRVRFAEVSRSLVAHARRQPDDRRRHRRLPVRHRPGPRVGRLPQSPAARWRRPSDVGRRPATARRRQAPSSPTGAGHHARRRSASFLGLDIARRARPRRARRPGDHAVASPT